MNRDDTNYLTREDVWRELELLPVWRLRAPIETVLAKVTEPKAIEAKEINQIEVINVGVLEAEKPSSAAPTQYEITISQDKHWAFVGETFACETLVGEISMPASPVDIGLQSTLLSNILHALQIEKPTIKHAQNLTNIEAKITVAMGERVAQLLLNTQDALENLRGKLHGAEKAHIIATYDLAHLLNYPVDKAKVWQDLCFARSYLQGLQVQD